MGKTYDLNVDPDWNISSVKQKLLEKDNIPVAQQRLIYAGKQLEDDKKITSYNIKNESTLHLVLKLSKFITYVYISVLLPYCTVYLVMML